MKVIYHGTIFICTILFICLLNTSFGLNNENYYEYNTDFEFDDGQWEDGDIYDPKSGKTYSCVIKMQKDGSLHVRGFIGISLLGRTTLWTKAE